MRADLRAAILYTREAARYMAKHEVRGNIIMISSMRAERAMPNAGLYKADLKRINQMTKCFCLDLAPFGIRVNSVEPGAIAVRTRRNCWNPECLLKWQTQGGVCGEFRWERKEMPRILLRQWHFWHQKKHPTGVPNSGGWRADYTGIPRKYRRGRNRRLYMGLHKEKANGNGPMNIENKEENMTYYYTQVRTPEECNDSNLK